MADEALRELFEWVRDCHRRYELDASEADDDRVSRKNMLAAELWKARADALESALSELARLRAEREWKPIETAPKETNLLVFYRNGLGKGRTARACYHTQLPWSDDHFRDDGGDGDFAPEGWYEESWNHETLYPLEESPTHWQPLPAPPQSHEEKQG